MDEDEWLKKFQKGSLVASFIFTIPLTVYLVAVAWYLPQPSDFQRQIAHFIAALDAALISVFLVGGIIVIWKTRWGLSISAGAGFAVLVLMLFVPQLNPFPAPSRPVGQPTFLGERLGTLLDILDERYASGEARERVLLKPEQRGTISNFALGSREWTGETWLKLVDRICQVNRCLRCSLSPDSLTLRLEVVEQTEKTCLDADCKEYRYACKKSQ